jgi:hypothetical protein
VDAVDLVGVVGEESVNDAMPLGVRSRAEYGDDERRDGEGEGKLLAHLHI